MQISDHWSVMTDLGTLIQVLRWMLSRVMGSLIVGVVLASCKVSANRRTYSMGAPHDGGINGTHLGWHTIRHTGMYRRKSPKCFKTFMKTGRAHFKVL